MPKDEYDEVLPIGGIWTFLMVGLTVLFWALSTNGTIDWPWYWITAPLWGGFIVALIVVSFVQWIFEMAKEADRRD